MKTDLLKSYFRKEIIKKSVKILRTHKISNEKIKQEILKDFNVDEKTVNEIVNNYGKQSNDK